MGRKWIARLLVLSLLLALTACSRDAAEEQAGPEDTSQTEQTVPAQETPEETQEEETEPAPDTSEEEPEPVRTAVTMEPCRALRYDDDGSLLVQENLALIRVDLADTAAAAAVNGVLGQHYDQRVDEAAALLEQARADKASAAQYGGAFNGYAITDEAETTRLDDGVLSLVLTTVDATGGAHGSTSAQAWNFDLTTGNQLTLGDLAADREALVTRLTDAIAAEIAADPEAYYSNAADLLESLVTDGAWCLTDDGVTVLCEPYYLAPFAAGVLRFTVAYDDLEDLLDPRWLPQEPAASEGSLTVSRSEEAGAPSVDLGVQVDEGGTEMVLSADGTVTDLRVRQVSSSDGATWYAGSEYLALNRLDPGVGVGVTAMLPDAMTNLMVTYTEADGTTAAYGIFDSGKDGSVFLQPLESVVDW